MMRPGSRGVLVAGLVGLAGLGVARADRRLAIDTPIDTPIDPPQFAPAAAVSPVIYLERCRGGCTVHLGANDSRTNTSMIPSQPTSTIGEFADDLGEIGAPADAEWAQIVQCMKEVYSPYAVMVTDVKPPAGASYHEAIIAGHPGDIGMTSDILGAAPLASDCSAIDNVVSFTFANQHPPVGRVDNICWTAAQESAHAYGLDHEYAFSNHRSACSDPMTYRADCGGQKFFRNQAATCGETAPRDCKCGGTQNSHQKLVSVFGPGTPITRPPAVVMTEPVATDGMLGAAVVASAGAQRGVARVALVINGFAWAEVPGAPFLAAGQPDPSSYSIAVPAALPDSIVDVQVVAYDDLEISTASPVVTVTKGAPCTTAAACATGQRCAAGKCLWDPPAGEIGDPCTYSQYCKSLYCEGAAGSQVCSQTCTVGAGSCPSSFVCEALVAGGDDGVCVTGGAGCCSVDRGGTGGWVPGGLAVALLVQVRLARRRRRPLRSQSPADDDSP
jgi:hypothetical protein